MASPDAVDPPAQLGMDGDAAAAAGPSAAEQVVPQPNQPNQGVKAAQEKALAGEGRRSWRSSVWDSLDRRAMLKAGLGAGGESRRGSSSGRGSSSCRFSFSGSSTGKRLFGRVTGSHSKASATAENAPAASAARENVRVRHSSPPPLLDPALSRAFVDAEH
jgi:hypothetical protein